MQLLSQLSVYCLLVLYGCKLVLKLLGCNNMGNSVYLIDYDVIAQRAHITYALKNKQALQISIV